MENKVHGRLQELRKEKGWSQSDLSEKSGVKLTTIQKLERGYNNILKARFDTLYALAKTFGVSVEYLVRICDKRQEGTGAILGIPVVVGLKDGVIKYVEMEDLKGLSAVAETFKLLDMFGVKKDEEIRICRGKVFERFCHVARLQGYTNIIPMEIAGELQEAAEDVFMESLYALGVDRDVKLHGKDYKQLQEDLLNQLMLHPELHYYVRPHFQLNPTFTVIVHKVHRLENEFPHLYAMLKSCTAGSKL